MADQRHRIHTASRARRIDIAVEEAITELRIVQRIYDQSNVGIRPVPTAERELATEAASRASLIADEISRLASVSEDERQ